MHYIWWLMGLFSIHQIPNDEMYWVVTTVVSETRNDMRAKLIKHFIKMASELSSLLLWWFLYSVVS